MLLQRSLLAFIMLLGLAACDSKSAFSDDDGIASTAPQQPASTRLVNASLKSFQCGEDACYLTFTTVNNSEINAICADGSFCTAWSMVNTGETFGKVNLSEQDGQRVKLTVSSELFEPAGENMDYVRKIEFLQE